MATGDAPIMKQKNYKVDNDKKVEWIIAFIRKYLKLEDSESLVRLLTFHAICNLPDNQFYALFSVRLCQSSFFTIPRSIGRKSL